MLSTLPILIYTWYSFFLYCSCPYNLDLDELKNIVMNHILQLSVSVLLKIESHFSEQFSLHDIFMFPLVLIITDSLHFIFHKFFFQFHIEHHSIKILAQVSSTLEHLVLNVFPVYFSAYIVGLSYYPTLFWFCLAETYSITSHFPNTYHSKHHIFPNTNYGTSMGSLI